MTSHMNYQQLESQIELLKSQIEEHGKYILNALPDQKSYYEKSLNSYAKQLEECEEMARARKNVAYYDIPIKDLYKGEWKGSPYGSPPVAICPDEATGVEIEYEGENLQCNPALYWKCNPENSLREYKGHSPVEYVLIKPLLRDDLVESLDFLEKKLKSSKANPVHSPRTSVHIHKNAQNLTWKQVVTWFVTYALVEDILVEFSGKERIGNLFCLRARDTQYFIHSLEAAIKEDCYSYVTNADYRYTSMNLASIAKFGSAEFRSMRSPIPFDDILKWSDVIQSIKDASLKWENPIKVIEYFESNGPKKTLKKIFPEPWMYQLFDHPNLTDIMWSAVREVKDVAYASDWLPKQAKPKEKEPEVTKFEPFDDSFLDDID